MNVLSLVITSVNGALVLFGVRVLARRPFDAVALYFYGVGVLMVLRPLLIGLGLHSLWPGELFVDSTADTDLLVDSQLIVTLWILASMAGIGITSKSRAKALKPGGNAGISDSQLYYASIGLTVLAAIVTVPLWIRFGGPDGLTRAFKVEKTVPAPFLRLVPLVATVIASASILSRMRTNAEQHRKNLRTLVRIIIFAACAYMSFSWGARDAPVFGLLAVLLGRAEFSRSSLSRGAQVALAALLVGGAIVGLRLARDIAIQDQVLSSITNENLVGQISIASNITMFDAFTLVVRDGPPGGDFSFGRDFVVAIESAVPSLEPSGDTRSVALQVAQEYRPDRANGWPITPIGDWYVNFGVLGALLGGLTSGSLINIIRNKTRFFYKDPVLYVGTLFVMATFLRGGLWARSINVGWQFLLALTLAVWAMRFLRFGDRTSTTDYSQIEQDGRGSAEANSTRLGSRAMQSGKYGSPEPPLTPTIG